MAAPTKVGLDYFSFDVDLLRDRKLRRSKMRYGYLATVVYIALLSIIYEDKGYYVEYGDNSKDDVIWQILEYLQGKHQPSYDTVADVIDDLVACELFSDDLYRAGIITSRRTQRTYYSATVSRKTVDIDESIWLLTLKEMKKLSAKHCYYLYLLNRPHNEVNQANNEDNRANKPQSKVKESKVKERKVNNTLSGGRGCYSSAISLFESIKAQPLTEFEIRHIIDMVDVYSEQWTLDALDVMGSAGKCRVDFAEGVLRNWKADGREAYKARKAKNPFSPEAEAWFNKG